MSRKVHIAGFPVRIGNELRQRCAWCGERLIDEDLSCLASPDGSPFGTWEVGVLVAVEGKHSYVVPHVDGATVPSDCCAAKLVN